MEKAKPKIYNVTILFDNGEIVKDTKKRNFGAVSDSVDFISWGEGYYEYFCLNQKNSAIYKFYEFFDTHRFGIHTTKFDYGIITIEAS